MEIYERIIELRKEHLPKKRKKKSITQNEFGELLGVSRSVIVNIEYNRVPIKDHMIKLICQTFNVNEEWLRNGTEPIFKEKENDIQTLLQKEYGLSELASSIIKSYIELPEEEQKIFEKFVFKVFKEMQEKNSKDEKEFEEDTKSFEDIVGNPDEILKNKKEKEEVS